MNILLAIVAFQATPVNEYDFFVKDYASWHKEYEASGYGWVMLGFEGCPACVHLKKKLSQLSKEEGGKRNIIYYDYRHPDVKTYKFEDYIQPPLIKGAYPLLLRIVRTKDNKNTLTYLQGDTTLEKLRKFLAKESDKENYYGPKAAFRWRTPIPVTQTISSPGILYGPYRRRWGWPVFRLALDSRRPFALVKYTAMVNCRGLPRVK